MFLIAWRSRSSPSTITNVGLVYQVVVSFTLPISVYWNAFHGLPGERLTGDLVGVSVVALWMLLFTVLVPTVPRKALVALILSGTAVPLTIGILIAAGNAPALPTMDFIFIFVVPYAMTVLVSYIAARVIYGLGRDVRRAQEMGSYQLLDLIGRGGMGEVWRARHNLLARPAAIKLIRRDTFDAKSRRHQDLLARFEREAQATAELESPHTVELHDFGVSEDGSLYYVMELLDGMDLESMVRTFGPLPPERVVHILRQVCHSLAEAHRRSLIHRDIKPANIVLCRRALEHDFVKVLDFGLAKHLPAPDRPAGLSLTDTQAVAGTPAYLAPEIALGRSEIDGRADLYSLGCVAFRLLTGKHVFEEDTPVAMIVAHTKEEPPPPSRYSEQDIPSGLDALVLKCLSKAPADRPRTAEDLALGLQSIEGERTWTEDRAAAWWRKHRPSPGS
jgi:serine/threonine-protein kinase